MGCKDILLLDVTPLSLGCETTGGVMTTIITRNTTIPCKKSDMFTTAADNQTQIEICIYEGERYRTKDNNLLGQFALAGIAPAPRGVAQVEITYQLDANGILNVTAKDKASNRRNDITIKNDAGRLSQSDVDRMIAEAEKYAKEDAEVREQVAAKQELEQYCLQIMDLVQESAAGFEKLTDEERETMEDTASEALEWIQQNADLPRMEFVTKEREGEKELKPLMTKMHSESSNTKGK